jgi:hypothetical protein
MEFVEVKEWREEMDTLLGLSPTDLLAQLIEFHQDMNSGNCQLSWYRKLSYFNPKLYGLNAKQFEKVQGTINWPKQHAVGPPCNHCNKENTEARYVRDHWWPKKYGGPKWGVNCKILCDDCNSDKSSSPEGWVSEEDINKWISIASIHLIPKINQYLRAEAFGMEWGL